MQPVILPYNNTEGYEEDDYISRDEKNKLDQEYNTSVDFHNNDDDSEKDKDENKNSGYDKFFVDNSMWEYIGNGIVIPYVLYHYCGPHGLKEGVEKLFKNTLE